MKLAGLLLLPLAVLTAASRGAGAADPRYPDWPCVQAKVPDLSIAAVWDGPPIDEAMNAWHNDPVIASLVARLAARRIPLDEAQKNITDFVAAAGADKTHKGVLLFAGLFDTLNHQRTEIMDGLERLQRREKDLADQIRADVAALRELQDKPQPDEAKINELNVKIEWSTRIFDDRRKSVRYACEVPTLIERRLGALARTIRQEME
jgi:Spy/CpxP family protein refolding chaperone